MSFEIEAGFMFVGEIWFEILSEEMEIVSSSQIKTP